MTKLTWDNTAASYSAGCDRGVLYLNGVTVAWNGLTTVEEVPDKPFSVEQYFEGVRHVISQTSEDFKIQVSAYTYPEEFSDYLGYDDNSDEMVGDRFGFSYRTGDSKTGKIHFVYNATSLPLSDYRMMSLLRSNDPTLFNWIFETIPDSVNGFYPSSHAYVDLSELTSSSITYLETILYGTESTNGRLPSLTELITILDPVEGFSVVDNGDGTWTLTGPDDKVQYLEPDKFEIDWSLVNVIDANTYELPIL